MITPDEAIQKNSVNHEHMLVAAEKAVDDLLACSFTGKPFNIDGDVIHVLRGDPVLHQKLMDRYRAVGWEVTEHDSVFTFSKAVP